MKMEDIEIIRKVMKAEISSIKKQEQQLNSNKEEFNLIIKEILALKGHLIIMGVGKSGHIGKKLAATFASTGTPSFFIHATEAMHGDLGMITKDDLVIIISNSGETSEALAPIDAIHRIGAMIIALTGQEHSTLARKSEFLLEVQVDREADTFNLAPTNSSTSVLVVGDSLALAISVLKNFTEEQFGMYHPGGALGRKLVEEGKL
ncbi:KpsF/GutQ family sugar-phosphate isomerase [Tetragenococcus halophilus]|uniref:KpsF/GutQ family sugar-phosphate isomerase n=1 Tax=Tetragenococcus halophilus TaxID=51669 RepID=A0A3G5FI55_TETHA|nr:SIS domain-containing protein [Tetragenococcus halophilus]AYW49818.1 KpsF/GutQ family sugar-phosphate isomerase [Tetragenococcus halophilus]